MNKVYEFPASAKMMLESHRKHSKELLETTDFLHPSNGYQRFAHYALMDNLLCYVFFLENGYWPHERASEVKESRPLEFGECDVPGVLDMLGQLKKPSIRR